MAYDKAGVADFARQLAALGVGRIFGSGGTIKHLKEQQVGGCLLIDVAIIVGKPILDHRVVSLSREIHAGLQAVRDKPEDIEDLEREHLTTIDLVYVDMYPLEKAIRDKKTLLEVLDKMDIGGPTALSSGSKGQRVVICDRADLQKVIDWIKADQPDELAFIEAMAAKADFIVSKYRMLTATYRSHGKYVGIFGILGFFCKYGENAWQKVCKFFDWGTNDPLAISRFTRVSGTDPSHNTICDLEKCLQTITHIAAGFDVNCGTVPHIAVGLKHGNACGCAIDTTDPLRALRRTLEGDPLAISGGELICNFPITDELADGLAEEMQRLGKLFFDFIAAPSFTEGAVTKLQRKSEKCRFLANPALAKLHRNSLDQTPRIRYVRGGHLEQPNYTFILNIDDSRITKYGDIVRQQELDMILAWAIGSTSNSNTITVTKNGMLLANAVGQQDRVGAGQLSVLRATRSKHDLTGAVAYSDSFFPFPDGPMVLVNAGLGAVFTSSGSIRDDKVIETFKSHNVALCMMPDADCRGFYGH